MEDFVFPSSFYLANMTYQLVELGSFNPIFTYFYQLERQIYQIETAKSRAGVSPVIVSIPKHRYLLLSRKKTFFFIIPCHSVLQ